MEKGEFTSMPQPRTWHWKTIVWMAAAAGIVGLVGFSKFPPPVPRWAFRDDPQVQDLPYGSFPQLDDPFQFIPCTDASRPPPLDDPTPQQSWAALFDANPNYWSWGSTGPVSYTHLTLPTICSV